MHNSDINHQTVAGTRIILLEIGLENLQKNITKTLTNIANS